MATALPRPGPSRPLLVAERLGGAPAGVPEPVVRGVSLAVAAGERLAITGANGGGKTTLALLLAGLLPAREGELYVGGRALEPGAPATAREQIAAVLQEPATQLVQRTVAEEMVFSAVNRGLDPSVAAAEAERWAVRLGIGGLAGRDPATLSAGQQQLVLLGAALTGDPAVLVADEATAHLDPDARERALAAVDAAVRRGLGVVWVTQEERELAWADRVMTLGQPDRAREAPEPSPYGQPEPAQPVAGSPRLRVRVDPVGGGRIRVSGRMDLHCAARAPLVVSGPNGCGKTSLLEHLAGLGPIPGVTMEWTEPPPVGPALVGQYPDRQIFAERVVEEILFSPLSRGRARDEAWSEASNLMQALGVERCAHARSWSLSAGEKRLIQLVAGLVAPTSVLLLDEPTCGLDAVRRSILYGLVAARARWAPVVIATQDPAWAPSLGARVALLG